MKIGTQSATVTARAVPRTDPTWPSAAAMRSHPSHSAPWTTTRSPCTCRAVANRGTTVPNPSARAYHRPITSATGSDAAVLKLPAARVVVNASTPNAAKSPIASRSGSTLAHGIVDPRDVRAECSEPLIDALISALDLPHVVDGARSLGTQRGEQDRHPRPNVGGLDRGAPQSTGSGHQRAVRIAQHDSRAHADELVHEKHAR